MKNLFLRITIGLLILLLVLSCNNFFNNETIGDVHESEPGSPVVKRTFYSTEVLEWMDNHSDTDSIGVLIFLRDDTQNIDFGEKEEFEYAVIEDGVETVYNAAGQPLSPEECIKQVESDLIRQTEAYNQRLSIRKAKVAQLLGKIDLGSKNNGEDIADSTYAMLECNLSKQVILKLENYRDLICSVELVPEIQPTLADAIADVKLSTVAHPLGLDGSNIGIMMTEADAYIPDVNNADFNEDNCTILEGVDPGRHATSVGLCIQAAAPDAMVYVAVGYFPPDAPSSYNPPINVSNYSWKVASGGEYRGAEMVVDNYVYDNKVSMFVSSGNCGNPPNYNVTNPAVCYNVFAVGNYDDEINQMASSSCYINPETGAEKPEIVAPGTNLSISHWRSTGTSLSSPIAAGFAACLMEAYTKLKSRPHIVKGYLMSGAINNIEGDARLSDIDGAGGINFYHSVYNGGYWHWSGGNGSFFDTNNKVTVNANLRAGKRYRMVLCWLVSGTYVYNNLKPNMDLNLKVKLNGTTITSSESTTNSFEIVDFTVTEAGTYQLEIERVWNSGEGNIIMGLVSRMI